MEIDAILRLREEHRQFIKQKTIDYQVVSLKANIPGINKRINEAYLLTDYFHHLIINDYQIPYDYFDDESGPLYLYYFPLDSKNLKEAMMNFENRPLGRLVDIDVYENGDKSESRTTLRKCYLCDRPAFVCGKLQSHSQDELIEYIKKTTLRELTSMIEDKVIDSIMVELNLHPKFGLVTPLSNGSHKDMNYELMRESITAFVPELMKMFQVGYLSTDSMEEQFWSIRNIGKIAEEKMFISTGGINPYRGLIFNLGLILWGVGHLLKTKESIFSSIKRITKDLINELDNLNLSTPGGLAYQKFKITGARGIAKNGFIEVQELVKHHHFTTRLDQLMALCELIGTIDDTVLLKRCQYDFNFYQEVKDQFKKIDVTNQSDVNTLDRFCIEHNLSFGGSADLLICGVFISQIQNLITIY